MRMTVEHRHGPDGSDEGLTFAKIDQQAIADQLTRLEPEILAKY
jgi:hypothetical protein